MAVIRQQNWLSQQRIDIPHLRSVESGVAGDFDLLAGRIIAGQKPLIINGFNITVNTSIINNPVTNLVLNVAGAQIIHFLASESGSIFYVPASRSPETLNSTNSKVSGSFTPSTTNYVGIDLVRSTDSTTNDLVQFVDPDTGLETSKTVPLARTLDYKIIIQTSPFASSSNIAPVAIVITDTNNSVTSVEDARKLMFRLGSGGDSPNASNTFSWSSRKENAISTTTGSADPFAGGDKQLTSLKDWIDAVNTRLWELGGGEYWYSLTSDKNVRLTFNAPTGGMLDNIEFNGTQIRWSGVSFLFNDSTAVTNTVTDQTTYQTINDKQCLYVDVNRATDAASLTGVIANLATLNSVNPPTVPGSRYVIAWRLGTKVYVRNKEYWVGKTIADATTTSTGVVRLLTDVGATTIVGGTTDPVVPIVDLTLGNNSQYNAIAAGITRGDGSTFGLGTGNITIGTGTADTRVLIGWPSSLTGINVGTNTKTLVIAANANSGGGSTAPINIISNTNLGSTDALVGIKNNSSTQTAAFYGNGDLKVSGEFGYSSAETRTKTVDLGANTATANGFYPIQLPPTATLLGTASAVGVWANNPSGGDITITISVLYLNPSSGSYTHTSLGTCTVTVTAGTVSYTKFTGTMTGVGSSLPSGAGVVLNVQVGSGGNFIAAAFPYTTTTAVSY